MDMKLRIELPIGEKKYTLDFDKDSEEGGLSKWVGRCRIPCTGSLPMQVRRVELASEGGEESSTTFSEEGDGSILIEGVASSTSVDWHGTEMSLTALHGMAQQFKAGVPYVPGHYEDEWDQVFGVTVDASVEQGQIANDALAKGNSAGYLLKVTTALYKEDSRAKRLCSLLSQGATVGCSIGGWFTEMEVITNSEDEVDRVIINGVELDHLAVTRRPSNPDSWISDVARSVSVAVKDSRSVLDAPNYEVSNEVTKRCGTCRHFSGTNWCGAHEFTASPDYVCESLSVESGEEIIAPADQNVDVVVDDGPVNPDDRTTLPPEATRAATSFANLPLAPPDAKFIKSPSQMVELKDNILGTLFGGDPDWDRYRKAFLWFDEERPEEKDSYKLAVARMYDPDAPDNASSPDGTLHVFYDKLQTVAERVESQNPGIPEEDLGEVKANLERYIEKFTAVEDEDLPTGEDEEAELSIPSPQASTRDACEEENTVADTNSCDSEDLEKEAPEFTPEEARNKEDTVPLDSGVNMGEKSFSEDAHRGAEVKVDTVKNLKQEERAMSDVKIEETAPVTENHEANTLEAIARSMDAMQGLLGKLVERDMAQTKEPVQETAPETKEVDGNVEAELRERLQAMEAKMARMAARPVRNGFAHSPNDMRSCQPGRLGEFVRAMEDVQGGASALAAVCKEQAERRSIEGIEELPSRGSLEKDLRSVLEAAFVDGVITDPDARNGWR
jgi:hypothetical protein